MRRRECKKTRPDRPNRRTQVLVLVVGEQGGFEQRLRERFPEIGPFEPAAAMVVVLELAALGLQAQAGCPVTFSRAAQTFEAGVYQVVVEYTEEDVGRLATEAGVKTLVLSHFVPGGHPFLADEVWAEAVRPYFSGRLVVGRDLLEL